MAITIQWPAEARCETCGCWAPLPDGSGVCALIAWQYKRRPSRRWPMVSPAEFTHVYTHKDHGCRAWEAKG